MQIRHQVGFIGFGNLAQALIQGLIRSKRIDPKQIHVTNRTPGKLEKAKSWGLKICEHNEDLIRLCDVVVLAVKPQDLIELLSGNLGQEFLPNQIVISLAAGTKIQTLRKFLRSARVARVIPNIPSYLNQGVLAYYLGDIAEGPEALGLETTILDLFEPLGKTLKAPTEEELNAMTVACASGTGFVLELMVYLQEWLQEYDLSPEVCRALAVQTFAGAALLASDQNKTSLEDLISRVASKKGTTEAGLSSMREFEIERALRYSLEKALLRAQELAKLSN